MILAMSVLAMMAGMTACKNAEVQNVLHSERQEKEFLREAIKQRSPDVQRVDLIGNTVVYTHIFDGIIDVKTYTYDGDVCVEAERIYTYPTQMSALRHYRRAVEHAMLYDNIEMFKHIPNLAGVSPWVLFDFRSPYRYHPTNQDGWNRKGLLSDQGYRKKAWYIMRDYYKQRNEVE